MDRSLATKRGTKRAPKKSGARVRRVRVGRE